VVYYNNVILGYLTQMQLVKKTKEIHIDKEIPNLDVGTSMVWAYSWITSSAKYICEYLYTNSISVCETTWWYPPNNYKGAGKLVKRQKISFSYYTHCSISYDESFKRVSKVVSENGNLKKIGWA
jgi:hypothetical protein